VNLALQKAGCTPSHHLHSFSNYSTRFCVVLTLKEVRKNVKKEKSSGRKKKKKRKKWKKLETIFSSLPFFFLI